jgi:hypothetical protein
MARSARRRWPGCTRCSGRARLPDRFGFRPEDEFEWRDLLAIVRRAVDEDLSERQRRVFVAIVVNGMPLDVLVAELATTRNAVYKTLYGRDVRPGPHSSQTDT